MLHISEVHGRSRQENIKGDLNTGWRERPGWKPAVTGDHSLTKLLLPDDLNCV